MPAVKTQKQNPIGLRRIGDFYEAHGSDAECVARVLGLTITTRKQNGSELAMCGFPHHFMEGNLKKLLASGCRVALLDAPAEDVSKVKKPQLIKRVEVDALHREYIAIVLTRKEGDPAIKTAYRQWQELKSDYNATHKRPLAERVRNNKPLPPLPESAPQAAKDTRHHFRICMRDDFRDKSTLLIQIAIGELWMIGCKKPPHESIEVAYGHCTPAEKRIMVDALREILRERKVKETEIP